MRDFAAGSDAAGSSRTWLLFEDEQCKGFESLPSLHGTSQLSILLISIIVFTNIMITIMKCMIDDVNGSEVPSDWKSNPIKKKNKESK